MTVSACRMRYHPGAIFRLGIDRNNYIGR